MGILPIICSTFEDFSDPSTLTLNGSAATVMSEGQTVLRLVPNNFVQAGTAFTTGTVSLSNGFSTFFQFQITGSGGNLPDSDGDLSADGIVFVVQSNSNAQLGGIGEGIGYRGIAPSVAVEFDTFFNEINGDIDGNHVGINTNGSMVSTPMLSITPLFNNGEVWSVWIDYSPVSQLLEVRVSNSNDRPVVPTISRVIDLFGTLGSEAAFVGFSSGTGASFGNHDILNWEFCIPES